MNKHTLMLKGLVVFCMNAGVMAADYPPNIDYGDEGDFVARVAVEQGRAAMISTAGPILIANPILPGSSRTGVDENFTDTSWDLSDLTNPTLIQMQNCFEDKCYLGGGPHFHSHLTSYHDGKAYLNSGRWWQFGTGGWLRYDPDAETSIEQMVYSRDPLGDDRTQHGVELGEPWRYSHLTSPYDSVDYWEYNFNPSGAYQLRSTDRSHGTVFAEWDHAGLTGVTGFPIFSGNLLIFVSDQQQTGMAIYDISGLGEGETPRLISRYNPVLNTPDPIYPWADDPDERLGGYWVEPYGANKVVWGARRRGTAPSREYPSLYIVDFTDPVNPQLTCELYFDRDGTTLEDGDLGNTETSYIGFQDHYAFTDGFKVDMPACEAAYAADKVVDEQEFANVVTNNNALHNYGCDTGQYFRPLGQVGVYGGSDLGYSHTIIEHNGGPLKVQRPYTGGLLYNVFRDSEPGVYRSGTPIGGFPVSRNLSDTEAAIPAWIDIQPGDTLHAEGQIIDVISVSEPDKRVNEQGLCFLVTHDEPDMTPPYVSGHRPLAGQTDVPVDSFIHFHIPETLRGDTLASAVTLTNVSSGENVEFLMQSSHTGTVSMFPKANMVLGDEYRVDIQGVQDFMGNTMVPYSFSFTTGESQYQAIDIRPADPAPDFAGEPYYPNHSGNIACEAGDEYDSIWALNPENDSVSLIYAYTDPQTKEVTLEVENDAFVYTDSKPTSVTRIGGGVAVTYADTDKLRFNNVGWWGTSPYTAWGIGFDYGDRPVASVGHGDFLYVALYGSGEIAKIDMTTRQIVAKLAIGPKPKAMALTSDGSRLLVTRFISNKDYGEVYDINTAGTMSFRDPNQPSIRVNKVLVQDAADHGSGVPNYLRSIVIGPNDEYAYITANKANIDRGLYLNGAELDDDNTIRPMIAVLDLLNHRDSNIDPSTRENTIDLDNSADPSGITILPDGVTRVHALQGSNVVEFVNESANKLFRANAGFAPQSLCTTERNMYVKNFTDRTVSVIDIADYMYYGTRPHNVQEIVTVPAEDEVRTAQELRGLQVFYHARTPDISPEGYISCASCHDDGGHDGMTWDLTHMGEGLRNTISLRGASGTRFGNLHWSSNFDEVQDFEAQIEHLNGGTGLISGHTFNEGVSPLTETTSGISDDLDAMAAYVASLGKSSVMRSPESCPWGGRCDSLQHSGSWVFVNHQCATCHTGTAFRDGRSHDMGAIKESSGSRLGAALTEIRTPTLIELWDSAPYLHDGSAETLEDVFLTGEHANLGLDAVEREKLVQYLLNLDYLDFIEDDEAFTPQ